MKIKHIQSTNFHALWCNITVSYVTKFTCTIITLFPFTRTTTLLHVFTLSSLLCCYLQQLLPPKFVCCTSVWRGKPRNWLKFFLLFWFTPPNSCATNNFIDRQPKKDVDNTCSKAVINKLFVCWYIVKHDSLSQLVYF